MTRAIAVGFMLVWTGGCTGISGGAAAPVVPAPADAPGQRAAAILNDCRTGDAAAQLACHEAAVLEILAGEGVAPAMAVVERMGDLDAGVRREGHVYAHAIGLAAYTTPEEVGRVFESCTAAFQSGCYHGVIQSYFVDVANGGGGVDAEAVNALCADQRGEQGDRWLLFQCAHGIGHGVTMLSDHHLPRALASCDLVADQWEREACFGGAFMESIVQATAPHHSVGRPEHGEHAHHGEAAAAPAPADEHAGHGVGGGAVADDFPPLKADDPLYPCNVLQERYVFSCYQMQTSPILFFNGGDFQGAADACRSAPERYQTTCFQSLGRDVSAYTVQDHPRALELCNTAGPNRFDCHWGYVKNLIDLTAQVEDGFEFCDVVPEDEGRRRCYETVGEQVWVLAGDAQGREALCSAAAPAYVESCRRGAGLPAAPAAGPPEPASTP